MPYYFTTVLENHAKEIEQEPAYRSKSTYKEGHPVKQGD